MAAIGLKAGLQAGHTAASGCHLRQAPAGLRAQPKACGPHPPGSPAFPAQRPLQMLLQVSPANPAKTAQGPLCPFPFYLISAFFCKDNFKESIFLSFLSYIQCI